VSEFRKGWKPLTAALIGTACGASPIPFNVLPLVLGPVHAEFGWDFAQAAAGVTIFGLIASFLAPVFGGMADRYGVRRVAIGSTLGFAIAFAAFWFMPPSLGGWYFLWAILGVVGIGSTPVTWSRAVSMWFQKNRGLALGLMLIGTSLSAMVVPQVVTRAMAAYGNWRIAFPVAALFPLLIALPIALLWFREPRAEERPAGVADASGTLVGLTLGEAARRRQFWILIVSILIIATAYGGAHIHMAQIVALHGFTPQAAASTLGVVALGILTGRLVVGLLFDRFWAPGVAFPVMLMPALACYLLSGTGGTLGTVMAGGFLLGLAAGTESDVIAFMAARYFGVAHYGRIYGTLYMPFGIGSAISPIIYGIVRDRTGNYDAMLLAAVVMFVVGGALLLGLGRYPAPEELDGTRA
jgi:MFS family permease